jgi:hypothetical protein
VDFLSTYGNLAAKLFRTFTMQVDALARKRGQIRQQTVRVERVTVEAGGQALVGAVAAQPPRMIARNDSAETGLVEER